MPVRMPTFFGKLAGPLNLVRPIIASMRVFKIPAEIVSSLQLNTPKAGEEQNTGS